MEDAFFSQLDSAAVRALLLHTELRDAAAFAVSDSLHIESCNAAAAQLSGLHPMEEIEPFLSTAVRDVLLRCIRTQEVCEAEEEVDGVRYEVTMVPHRTGALLAYLRRDRAAYDGSLRVIQSKSSYYLGMMLQQADRVSDPAVADELRHQCMRMYRLLSHSDSLHDPLLPEQIAMSTGNLAELCRDAARRAQQYAPAHCAKISTDVPEICDILMNADLIRTALYNLLTNALRVTPEDGEIVISLRDGWDSVTVTVSDTGPGLDPACFEELLTRWRRTTSLEDYCEMNRSGTSLGLGLPLVNQIARQHGGCLLLSPRKGGGSELHLSIARLPAWMGQDYFCAPAILKDGYAVEEIEFSVLE